MKNFQFLFGAWVTVWVVFLFYDISVGRRISQVQEEIKRLSERLSK